MKCLTASNVPLASASTSKGAVALLSLYHSLLFSQYAGNKRRAVPVCRRHTPVVCSGVRLRLGRATFFFILWFYSLEVVLLKNPCISRWCSTLPECSHVRQRHTAIIWLRRQKGVLSKLQKSNLKNVNFFLAIIGYIIGNQHFQNSAFLSAQSVLQK